MRAAERPRSSRSEERALFTKATALIPTDGVVKETSDRIVQARGATVRRRGDLRLACREY